MFIVTAELAGTAALTVTTAATLTTAIHLAASADLRVSTAAALTAPSAITVPQAISTATEWTMVTPRVVWIMPRTAVNVVTPSGRALVTRPRTWTICETPRSLVEKGR
jgi:hypothetical protein